MFTVIIIVIVLCVNWPYRCAKALTALRVNHLSSSVCLSLKSLVTALQKGEPTATWETLVYSLGSLRGLQNITGECNSNIFFLYIL